MNKIKFLLPLIFLLSGCAYLGLGASQDERSLALSQQYQALELTYKNQYKTANEQERQWLRSNVATVLDEARHYLIRYNQRTLDGKDATDQKLELIHLLRTASSRMLGD